MRVAPLWALALAVLPLALAGCGEPGVVPDQDAEGRYVVRLTADNRFVPMDIRVPAGATVLWVVEGGFHDVSADDGSFTSAKGRPLDSQGFPTLMGPGETFEHTFTGEGKWIYWCHTHHEDGMKGIVRVG